MPMFKSLLVMTLLVLFPGTSNAEPEAASGTHWPGMAVLKGSDRGYVKTPMGLVHFQRRGEGLPLLLLHQTPWFSVQFSTAMPILAEMGIEAIAPDRPGYGLSDPPASPPSIEDYADNLVHVLDALGYDKIAVLGHHTGSSVAAAFAQRYPERVSRLILHGVPLYSKQEQEQRLNRPHWSRWLEPDGAHLSSRFAARADRLPAGEPFQGVQWSTLAFFMAGETEWYGHVAAFTFDMDAAIRSIKAPMLIMAHRDDPIYDQTARAAKIRPDATYREFDGGYSHIMYDHPQEWAEAVGAFVLEGNKPR